MTDQDEDLWEIDPSPPAAPTGAAGAPAPDAPAPPDRPVAAPDGAAPPGGDGAPMPAPPAPPTGSPLSPPPSPSLADDERAPRPPAPSVDAAAGRVHAAAPSGDPVTTESVIARFAEDFGRLAGNVEQVLKGKHDIVTLALVCLFAEGHLLLEDVPGVGKTSLARAMAASIDATWQRIQFTPDLLPSDVTGVSIFNQATQQFEFHPGPVFANIVIGDEINRASPKTQAALLEVMEEHQVTVEGRARPVARPFMVIATQNPIEMDGTYRLPEAQLDRFLLRASIGYPDTEAEVQILSTHRRWNEVESLQPVLSAAAVQRMIDVAAGVHVADAVVRYVAALTAATRSLQGVRLGVSPRGSLALVRAARALAEPVLAHRLILSSEAEIQGHTPHSVIEHVLAHVPVPTRRSE